MLSFRTGRSDEPPGSDLLGEMIAHLNEVYPGRAASPGSVTRPEQMVRPVGVFLVGYQEGRPVACGGLRRLHDGVAEIKRTYVSPASYRSAGYNEVAKYNDNHIASYWAQKRP